MGLANRDYAAGARVYVTTDDAHVQLSKIKNGSSPCAGSDLALHIGLGQSALEDVTIVWPNGLVHKPEICALVQEWTFFYPLRSNAFYLPSVTYRLSEAFL